MDTDTDTVEDTQEYAEQEQEVQEEAVESVEEEVVEEEKEQKVPLSALQKERKKRQDWEQRAKLYEQKEAMQMQEKTSSQSDENEDEYETATVAQVKSAEKKIIQTVTENLWCKEHPEKVTEVDEKLEEFLKQKPHLKYAIEAAPNRYEEAWTLLNALTPRQKAALKPNVGVKKPAPNSPSAVPKATGVNQVVDVMNMTDAEFSKWRASKIKR